MDVAAGTKIANRYVIERPLAQGGMGAVFVARDTRMDSRVALKVTAAGGAAADELGRRFAREARIGNRLGAAHRGFVRASDWGRIDTVQLYLVMDLVEDAKPLDLRTGSLDERLGRWRRAAELVRIAHENGVVHRDLKPANFLQKPDGSIFLTDFGLAKIVDETVEAEDEQRSLTMTGVGFGTPPYMPPEQLEDAKHAGVQADVYALGCMLFESVALRLPYPGPAPSAVMTAQVRVRAGAAKAPRLRDADPAVAAALDTACALAMELEVERRTPSVAALFESLNAAGAATRLEAAPAPLTIGSAVTAPPVPDAAKRSSSEKASGSASGRTAPLTPSAPSPGARKQSSSGRAPRSAPSAPALSNLPTGDGVPTGAPAAPPSSRRSPPRSVPSRTGSKGALAVTAVLLLIMAGAVAADVGGVRRKFALLVASPAVTTERPPEPTTERPSPPVTEQRATPERPPPVTDLSTTAVSVSTTVSPSPSVTVQSSDVPPPPPPTVTEQSTAGTPPSPPPAPHVSLVELSPKDGTVLPTLDVDVAGRIDPPTGAVWVSVAGNDCPVAPDGAFNRRVSLNAGANRVQIEVQPAAADQVPLRRTITLTADVDDPRVTLEVPAEGFETADATVELRGRVDDATAVEVSIAGEVVARVSEGGGVFSTQVALATLGPRALEVQARDAGGRTTRLTRTVVRRAARLELTLDVPVDETETNASRVRVAGDVTGDAVPGTLEVRANGVTLRLAANGAFDQLLPLAFPEGEHTVEVLAVGRGPAGDSVNARIARRLHVDRTAPVVRLLEPVEGMPLDEGPVTVRAEVSDAAAWVDLTIGGGRPTRVPRGQTFSRRVTLYAGVTEVVLVATDPAGNRSETRRRVTRVERPNAFCNECGAKFGGDDEIFCRNCGTKR